MLTPAEQAELAALESELTQGQSPSRSPSAPARSPGDLSYNIQALTPDEEAELMALEGEFAQREAPGAVDERGLVTQVLEGIDSYTGAPLRKAVGTFQDTNSLAQTGSAFIDQFGENPSLAPTGKEIAANAGLSTENVSIPRSAMQMADDARVFNGKVPVKTHSEVVSPAGMAGVALDAALDITNLLPFAGMAAKGAKNALKAGVSASGVTKGATFVKAGETVADTAAATIKATKESRIQLSKLFKPDIVPDFKETKNILLKNNIPANYVPEALEYGERSIVSRLARNTAEGPLGGDALEKHYKFVQDVSKATEENISKISNGVIPSKGEAGRVLRDGYETGVENFFSQMDFTYNSIIESAPGIQLTPASKKIIDSKMAGIEKSAIGLTRRGITATDRSQGKELLNAISAYRNAGPSLKQQKEAMQMIGRTAFKVNKAGAELPSDIRSLREMYFSLQKGFTESTRAHLGDDIANALIENNRQMSKHFTERGPLAKVLESAKADEEIFETLVMRGNSKQIGALIKILPEENIKQLKAAYLDNLLSRNADNVINFRSTRNVFNSKKEKLLNVFSVDELQDIEDLLKVGDKAGQATLSSSGTGASNMFADIKGALQNKIGGDALLENMKKGAQKRANYVEVKNTAPSGKPPSGFSKLKDSSPISKKQAIQAGRTNTVNQRNERLEQYKKMRGL